MKLQKGFFKFLDNSYTTGYTYTNTRVKAMKAKLIKKEDFQKFLKMSVSEIARYLQETEYNREITELAPKFSGANLIEYALNKNLENTFAKILNFALQEAKNEIKLYLKRYDIVNIKTILRGKSSNVSNEHIINQLTATGELSRGFLERVIKESSNPDKVIENLKQTEYYLILKKNSNDLSKLEDELDKSYYITTLEKAGKELKEYIQMEIAVKNTLNKLRAKKSGIKIDIIPGGKKLKIPYQEDSIEARVFMKKFLTEKGIKMVHEVKRNIKPVLGYFVTKENEINNIRILVRGKHSGLIEEQIQKQLVI